MSLAKRLIAAIYPLNVTSMTRTPRLYCRLLAPVGGAVVVVALLASCSTSRESSTTTAVSDRSDVESSASTASDDEIANGDDYLAIVEPMNCQMKRYNEAESQYRVDGVIDPVYLDELAVLMGETADARRKAASQLLELKWPDAVAPIVVDLAQVWFGVAKLEDTVSQAEGMNSWNATVAQLLDAYSDPKNSGLSSMVRAALGLSDNGGDYAATLDC